ncbi:hypothetical protein SAMN05443429_10172 [Cruoricaptor ignavus]|uniref:SprB repeat-containing protein n=1 Tax=Cruoricaptor ignavus TaxID=1118202 RepID=A0A1M6A0Q0_9FLAO|nr:hypothetical protein [Cruoricaptor ignavus]SHI29743.1 hypothetical protein SAMN05443429_10172 [Cruoricaptor ignavus]
MKKILSFLLLLSFSLFIAQDKLNIVITSLNHETCPSNGSVEWKVTNGRPNGSYSYTIIDLKTNKELNISSGPSYSSLPAGNYQIIAVETISGETVEEKRRGTLDFVIKNQLEKIKISADGDDASCEALNVNVLAGKGPYTYNIYKIDSKDSTKKTLIKTDKSASRKMSYADLSNGFYDVEVIDACGENAFVYKIGITKPIWDIMPEGEESKYDYLYGFTVETCGFWNFKVGLKNNLDQQSPNQKVQLKRIAITYTDAAGNRQVVEELKPAYKSSKSLGETTVDRYGNDLVIPNTAKDIKLIVEDLCGKVQTLPLNPEVLPIKIFSSTSCKSTNSFTFKSNTKFKILKAIAPDGSTLIPQYNADYDTLKFAHTFSNTENFGTGIYKFEVEDQCGNKKNFMYEIKDSDPFVYYHQTATCEADKTYVIFNTSDADFEKITIKSASAQGAGETYYITQFVKGTNGRSKGAIILPIGKYTYTFTTKNCPSESQEKQLDVIQTLPVTVAPVSSCEAQPKIQVTWENLGTFELNRRISLWKKQPNGTYSFYKEAPRDRILKDDPKLTQSYTWEPRNLPTGIYQVRQTGNVYNTLKDDGLFYSSNCSEPSVIYEFEYNNPTDALEIKTQSFECSNKSYNLFVSAKKGSQKLTYALSKNGVVIHPYQNEPVFTKLEKGVYIVHVKDECGKVNTQAVEVTVLYKPGISVDGDCDGNVPKIRLRVNDLDVLRFEWRKIKDANGNLLSGGVLSTKSFLDLENFTADKAGVYQVHITSPEGKEYCVDTYDQITLREDSFTNPSAGQDSEHAFYYDGTQSHNLFDYLGGQPDTFGKWEVMSDSKFTTIDGNRWNIAENSPGTYKFKYTVNALCGSTTISRVSQVIIHLLPEACYRLPATDGQTLSTNAGITALGRAGAENDNWPMVRKGAWLVMEANTKGFVINRVDNPATKIPKNKSVKGMMVYDTTEKCLKIYDGNQWKCFNKQACPDHKSK